MAIESWTVFTTFDLCMFERWNLMLYYLYSVKCDNSKKEAAIAQSEFGEMKYGNKALKPNYCNNVLTSV